MAVLLRIQTHRTMQPHRPFLVELKQQLVEIHVLLNELEVLLALFHRVNTDIHRLAGQMLRIADTMDTGVDLLRAEPAIDVDRSEHLTQRLTQFPAQINQCGQLQVIGCIVLTMFLRPFRSSPCS